MMFRRRGKILIFGLLVSIISFVAGSEVIANYLIRNANSLSLKFPSSEIKETHENITIISEDSIKLKGWLILKDTTNVVILVSGIRGNRLGQIDRANYYLNRGFSVLMLDLRGTGESEGDKVTFGWNERNDIISAAKELTKRGFDNIACHGTSLGAAAIVFSFDQNIDYHFVVLESCYDDIENALVNRLKKRKLPPQLFYLVRKRISNKLKVSSDKLAPINYIGNYKKPILIMAGTNESQLLVTETEAIYNQITGNEKMLHLFEEATHEDLYKFDSIQFLYTLNSFFEEKIFKSNELN